LIEEFIDGREFYVGVLGNDEPQALAPIELDFSGLPDDSPRVADSAAKWAKGSLRYKATKSVVAQIPAELSERLQKTAVAACRALQVRDYGRVDMRLTEAGELYVIEVNGNCYLEKGSEFAMAAAASGMDYHQLITRLTELAIDRYRHRKLRRPRRAPVPTPAPAAANGKDTGK
jgi:D-alanine-D-alanine ligase